MTLPCDLQDTPDEVKKALQVELDNIQDKSTEELISLAQEMADFKHTVLTVLKEEDEEEIRNNLKNIHQKLVDNGEITER